jgi:ankyrin repeat protein
VLRELLKHGANVNTAKKDGDTPLHIAGGDGHVEVLRELLNYGTKVNTENKGHFLVYVAFQKGHIEVVRELVNNATNVETTDEDSFTPLEKAGQKGHIKVL